MAVTLTACGPHERQGVAVGISNVHEADGDWALDFYDTSEQRSGAGDWDSCRGKADCGNGEGLVGISEVPGGANRAALCRSLGAQFSGNVTATLTVDAGRDQRRATREGDWAAGYWKLECGENEYVAGVSENAPVCSGNARFHALRCAAAARLSDSCETRAVDEGDSRGTTASGDWDYGAYKAECGAGQYVAGVSVAVDSGHAHSILCCAIDGDSGGGQCGAQPPTPTFLLPTELGGGAHPADAASNPEYNLELKGYTARGDAASFQLIGGNTDYHAINLTNLWPNRARPANPFSTVYEVDGDANKSPYWKGIASGLHFDACEDVILPGTGLPGSPNAPSCPNPPAGQVEPSHSPALINANPDEQALVVYAGATTLTLQFTRRDGPTGGGGGGYTVYLDNLEVNPGIIADYEAANRNGRAQLPALAPNARLGRARGDVVIAVRDTNTWMDTRFKKDWWQDAWTAQDGPFPCNGN